VKEPKHPKLVKWRATHKHFHTQERWIVTEMTASAKAVADSKAAGSEAQTLAVLLEQVGRGYSLVVRQRAVYAIAALLAHGELTDESLEHLHSNSPFAALVELGAGTEERSGSLTLQLVLSCAANLAQILVPLGEQAAPLGRLIGCAIVPSNQADGKLRSYALSAGCNVLSEAEALYALEAVPGCVAALEAVSKRKAADLE
jgi:hypothetical protein